MRDVVVRQDIVVAGITAEAIGERFARGKRSMIDSANCFIECGHMLTQKKSSMSHGQWLPWFAANEATLGFDIRAAQLLMKGAAKTKLLRISTEDAARAFNQQLWGNAKPRGTGDFEWYTPARFVDATRTVLGKIDLDPCSCEAAQETVKPRLGTVPPTMACSDPGKAACG
jgi:hypothetical protein